MTYRIYIESRMDKQKLVVEVIRELTDNFVILQGRSFYNKTHARPCQMIVIETALVLSNVDICAHKLKKILGMSAILITRTETAQILY